MNKKAIEFSKYFFNASPEKIGKSVHCKYGTMLLFRSNTFFSIYYLSDSDNLLTAVVFL